MSLAVGTRLGPYVILAPIGAGGMGEVYRARDGKLNRDVALKVLPQAFAADPERLLRFRREAQVLASLSHPNIGHIYGFEDSGATHALVLELIEGPTLADRIARGPIPLSEALPIVRQIAGALETAHEQGIIHRDLKPANIKVKDDGTVKVLDFGLAKALAAEPASAAVDAMNSPTLTSPAVLTRRGVILGTAAYMSPEQTRGKVVDKRTDIWAFGCVLFEMLTGRLAFKGDTVSDTIVAILGGEPEWGALPAATPAGGRGLLQRCLEKDPKLRLRDLGDARIELDQLDRRSGQVEAVPQGTPSTPGARPRRARPLAAGLIGVVLLVLAGAAGVFYATRPRVAVTTPSEYTQITNFTDAAMAPSLSPDGRMVTFKRGVNTGQVGAIGDFLGAGQICVKLLPNGDSVQLTNGPGSKYGPVFTPDGSRIAYTGLSVVGNSFSWDTWTVPVLGGEPTRLLPNASGLTWIGPQRVLFSEITTGLHMGIVTATEARAESRAIYFPALDLGMAHYSYASPDLKSILIVEMANQHAFDSPCRLVPFDGSSAGRHVGPSGTCLSAAWSPDGKWMYFAADVGGNVHLWRQKFPDGTPEQMTFGANEEQGIAVAPDGRSLITSIGKRLSAIWIHDAAGERAITSEGYATAPRLSAGGKRVFYLDSANSPAFSPVGPAPGGELRVVDLASAKTGTVLPGMSITDYEISRDGREIVFTTTDSGGEPQMWLAPVDRRSSPRQITRSGDQPSFGANGDVLFRLKDKNVNFLYRMKKDGTERERVSDKPILIKFGVSPDGEWVIASVPMAADDNPSSETVKVPVETVAIPVGGGVARRICGKVCPSIWSPDGRFFYVDLGAQTRAMPVPAGKSLPEWPAAGLSADDTPDARLGVRVIQHGNVSAGGDPSTYVFRKTELHANLFRIPLH